MRGLHVNFIVERHLICFLFCIVMLWACFLFLNYFAADSKHSFEW